MAAEVKRRAGEDRLLPPEIWSEILNRLPVKSILRCRSVCKSWYSLVSCPSFISGYSVRNLNKNGNCVLLQFNDYRYNGCSFSSHAESFTKSREHDDYLEPFLGSIVQIVGSCNGLICLSNCDHRDPRVTFLIWNPTLTKVVEIPSRTVISQNLSYFGFGFDPKTNDHKVLRMCTNSAVLSGDFTDVVANVCDVYDLSNGVWRGISPLEHPLKVERPSSECYLNGAIHWTGYRHGRRRDRILLSFNMSDEIFREIRMPDCAEFTWDGNDDDAPFTNTRSVTFGGLIHVIVWDMYQVVNVSHSPYCSVWAMKEYGVTESWSKLFNITASAEGCPTPVPYTLRLWKNGEALMARYYYDVIHEEDFGQMEDLVSYNIGSRTWKHLFSSDKRISDVCLYEESLFLI